MSRRVLSSLLFALLASFASVVQAAVITASPRAASPGADIVASAQGLVDGEAYRIELVRPGTFPARYTLSDFTASGTESTRRLRLPTTPTPGTYELQLSSTGRGAALLDTYPFTVKSPLGITFEPTSAEPGRSVRMTVTGVVAGGLSVSYAGGTVIGPVAVGDGTWVGKFLVPRDRPATLPGTANVVVTNTVGRLIAARGTRDFSALAPSGLPRFRSTFSAPPPAAVEEGTRLSFAGRLATPDNKGTSGKTSFFWRSSDGKHVVPIDGGVTTDAQGNYTLLNGRAPSEWMDGVPRSGSGEVISVISDEDPDSGMVRDTSITTSRQLSTLANGAGTTPPSTFTFTLKVRGRGANGLVPLQGAYVEVLGAVDGAFSDPADSAPATGEGDLLSIDSQFSNVTHTLFENSHLPLYTNGCEVSFARQFTNAQGEVTFAFDPEAVRRAQILEATAGLGEIRTQGFGSPVPGIDVWQPGEQVVTPGKARKTVDFDNAVTLVVRIAAGQQGYGEWGIGSQGDLAGLPLYESTKITLAFDADSGEVGIVSGPGVEGNTLTTSGQLVDLRLQPLPPASAGVVPFRVRIDGLKSEVVNGVTAPYKFKGMHTFPNASRWTMPGEIVQPNVGRKIRFAWEAGFGNISQARLSLVRPDGSVYTAPFAFEGPSACDIEGINDYVASLPDMTRWPANPEGQSPYCRNGVISVDLVGKPTAHRMVSLCTRLPPASVDADQVVNLRINALTTHYTADIAMPTHSANAPAVPDWEIPALENTSQNDGNLDIAINQFGTLVDNVGAGSGHVLGNEDTDPTAYLNGAFGFDGAPSRANIIRNTVLDTGTIPLFRYPWGFSPIAGAVFGADFWLSADLAFYGSLSGDGANPVNATIDPTMNGGIDVFFDLDVLFGLVSASVSAQPQLGLSLKETVGDGGLPGDSNGRCFGFDVDVAMEICAVFCAEDEFNLFRTRSPSGCSVNMKRLGFDHPGYDLPAPKLAPSALGVDGQAHTVVLETDAANRLVAYHLDGTDVVATRVVSPQALAVQHIDVEYLGNDKALAVWSESSLPLATLQSLMTASNAVRNSTAEIARAQVLRWSLFDGNAWSAPAAVRGAKAGSGKPKLAVGRCLRFDCLRSSSASVAYLVWEHDLANNLAAPRIGVFGSLFEEATGFNGAFAISDSVGSSDMHPDVTWLGARPLVAWIHSPLPHYQAANARRLYYRVIDDVSGDRVLSLPRDSGLPTGAGWPSLARVDSDTAVLAFTLSADGTVVGNRQALNAAQVDCTGTVCTFQRTELRDPAGRQLRGERPIVAVDEEGEATISFRGLAYGPDARGNNARSTDSLGMVIGTGEHLVVHVPGFGQPQTSVAVQGFSADGLQHWRPDMVFDPASDAFLAISRAAVPPVGKSAAYEAAKRFAKDAPPAVAVGKALGSTGLTIKTLAATPDFRIEALQLSPDYLQVGTPAGFRVVIRNAGADYDPALHGQAWVHVAWDAPPGAGIEAMPPLALNALSSAASIVLSRQATVPAGHRSDERRTLFVEVRPDASTEDAFGPDNLAFDTTGEMPVPIGLVASVKNDSPMVTLDWTTATDPRVFGYRVYKLAENGNWVPYGSSTASGYADLFAGFRDLEHYRITSYSQNGIESDMSQTAVAQPKQATTLFESGFETQ